MIHPDVHRNKAPVYSMYARNEMPGDTTMKPGPGAHSPEKVCHLHERFTQNFAIKVVNINKLKQ